MYNSLVKASSRKSINIGTHFHVQTNKNSLSVKFTYEFIHINFKRCHFPFRSRIVWTNLKYSTTQSSQLTLTFRLSNVEL